MTSDDRELAVSASARTSAGSSGSSCAPGETLGLDPEDAEVGDDDRTALAVAQDVDSSSPVVEAQTEVIEHPVRELHPEDARPAAAVLLGPVLLQQDPAESTHVVAL